VIRTGGDWGGERGGGKVGIGSKPFDKKVGKARSIVKARCHSRGLGSGTLPSTNGGRSSSSRGVGGVTGRDGS